MEASQASISNFTLGSPASLTTESSGSSPKLQQKIEVVQQILTVLEATMASAKLNYTNNKSSLQERIDNLCRAIEVLKTKVSTVDEEFSNFSSIVGGEINRLCALDNILRTVEESRTENDVKILLPDISKIDQYVHTYTSNRRDEWEKLKTEITRLNFEPQNGLEDFRKMILRVTLKPKRLSESQTSHADHAASIINEIQRDGKISVRPAQEQIPAPIVKYLTLSWDQNNPTLAVGVSDVMKVVNSVYQDQGDVVSVERISSPMKIVCNAKEIQLQQQDTSSLGGIPAPYRVLYQTTGLIITNSESAHTDAQSALERQHSGSQSYPVNRNNEAPREINHRISDNGPLANNPQEASRDLPPPNLTLGSFPTTMNQSDTLNFSKNNHLLNDVMSVINNNIPEKSSGLTNQVSAKDSNGVPSSSGCIHDCGPVPCDECQRQNQNTARTSEASFPIAESSIVNSVRNQSLKKFLASALRLKNPTRRTSQRLSQTEVLQPSTEVFQPSDVTNEVQNQSENVPVGPVTVLEASQEPLVPSDPTGGEDSLTLFTELIAERPHDDHEIFISPVTSSVSKESEEDPRFQELDGIRLKRELVEQARERGLMFLQDYQKEVLRAVLNGKDVMCRARRKTGKSILIALCALQTLKTEVNGSQILIATPSLIVSDSVVKIVSDLGRTLEVKCSNADTMVASSSSISSEFMGKSRLLHSHVLVGVPNSLLELIKAQKFQNETIVSLLLDGVDDMLAQGLKSVILQMIYALNASTQVVALSSENSAAVEKFATNLRDPIYVCQSTDSCVYFENTVAVPSPEDSSSNDVHSPLQRAEPEVIDCFSSSSMDEDSDERDVEMECGLEDDNVSLTLSRCSSAEIETMVSAQEIFSKNGDVMTLIPDYMYESLGIALEIDPDLEIQTLRGNNGADHFYELIDEDVVKIDTLSMLEIEEEKTIIFCNTIKKVESLSALLRHRKLWPQEVHENLTSKEWGVTLQNYSTGVCKLLVTTDFLTEIVIQSASLVINYEFPTPLRNYVDRAAFAERQVRRQSSRRPMVLSFMKEDMLKDVSNVQDTFGILIQPMSKPVEAN